MVVSTFAEGLRLLALHLVRRDSRAAVSRSLEGGEEVVASVRRWVRLASIGAFVVAGPAHAGCSFACLLAGLNGSRGGGEGVENVVDVDHCDEIYGTMICC